MFRHLLSASFQSSPSSPTHRPYIPCLRCMWDCRNNIWGSCLYINLSNIVVLTLAIADAGVKIYTSSFTNYDWPQISSLQVYAASLMGCVKCAQPVFSGIMLHKIQRRCLKLRVMPNLIYTSGFPFTWNENAGQGAEVAQPGVPESCEVVLNHKVQRSTSWIQSVWYIRSLQIPM